MPAPVGRNSFWPSIINLMKKKKQTPKLLALTQEIDVL